METGGGAIVNHHGTEQFNWTGAVLCAECITLSESLCIDCIGAVAEALPAGQAGGVEAGS